MTNRKRNWGTCAATRHLHSRRYFREKKKCVLQQHVDILYLSVKLKEKCFFSFFKYGLFMFYFSLSVFGFVNIFVGVMDITLLGRRIKWWYLECICNNGLLAKPRFMCCYKSYKEWSILNIFHPRFVNWQWDRGRSVTTAVNWGTLRRSAIHKVLVQALEVSLCETRLFSLRL